jgi:hypothetical protein
MTPRLIPKLTPDDLSGIPDDWLEAYVSYLTDGGGENPDAGFRQKIEAVHRMRDIEQREGQEFLVDWRNATAELLRRRGKDVPLERGQVYDWNGVSFQVTRISAAHGWADIRCTDAGGASWAKRQPLPLPADSRLAGWMRP